MESFRKSVVAVVGALVVVLGSLGVPLAEGLPEAVVALLTAAAVYFVPNE